MFKQIKNISVKWKAKGTTVWATEMLSGWKKFHRVEGAKFHRVESKVSTRREQSFEEIR